MCIGTSQVLEEGQRVAGLTSDAQRSSWRMVDGEGDWERGINGVQKGLKLTHIKTSKCSHRKHGSGNYSHWIQIAVSHVLPGSEIRFSKEVLVLDLFS